MQFSFFNYLRYYLGCLWTEWGGRRRIEATQLRRLRKLVEHARRNSPLFQELYRDVPPTEHVRLRDLPVTRKPELMAQFDRWLTVRSLSLSQAREHMADIKNLGVPISNLAVVRTSGTSGEPAVIAVPSSVLELQAALPRARLDKAKRKIARHVDKAGFHVGIGAGSGHFAGNSAAQLFKKLAPRLGKRLVFIDANTPIAEIVEKLNSVEPMATLTTYPSMMELLVREKQAGRLKAEPILFTASGETLTDGLRARVRASFPNVPYPINNMYACTECPRLGIECSHGRQHLPEDWVILEPVDSNYRPVEDDTVSDTVLLTFLGNEVQPFIRYDLGDRIRFYSTPCPCGSPFRSFQIEGRDATVIKLGNVSLSPLVFDLEHEGALRVQLVQTAETAFELRAELLESADPDTVFAALTHSVQDVLEHNGVSNAVVRRSDKEPIVGESGKFREVIPLKK